MNRQFSLLLVLLLVAFTAAGCGMSNRQPRYDVVTTPEGTQVRTFKRFAAHPSRDYVFNFKRKAYREVTKPLSDKGLSASQRDVLTRHGQPDHVRRSFKATTGELVNEWTWWDRGIVTQFVQNELVWEDKLTDMDRYRIRYGTPRRAWQQAYERGSRRDLWDYQGLVLDTGGTIVTFTDEALVSSQGY